METKTDYAVSQPSDFLSSTSSVIEGLGCRCGDDFRQVQNGWQKVSHFLVDSDNLTNLQLPVGASSRIKYTSISVSFNYIALGTNTGAVHVFDREVLHYRLPACGEIKDGCITQIAFCPSNDDILAFATSSGTVCIMQLNIDRRERPEILRTVLEHKGSVVTSLCWSNNGKNLYIGDEQGVVNGVRSAVTKNKSLFRSSLEFLFKLESAIVQIDTYDNLVLVSCLTSTHIAYTSRKQFKKIGTKPRNGEYGSCFHYCENSAEAGCKIYCARPGSRLWEVDANGNVINTQQLKVLLDDQPAVKIVSLSDAEEKFEFDTGVATRSLAFPKLYRFSNKLLLTHCDQGLLIIDPTEVQVVHWTASVRGVMQLSCYRNHIYVLFVDGSVRKLSVLTATKLWQVFYAQQQWLRCAWLSLNVAACQLPRPALIGLSSHLRDAAHVDMAQVIADLALEAPDGLPDAVMADAEEADHLRNRQPSASFFQKLKSGIYSRVDEKLLDCDVECNVDLWSVSRGEQSKTKATAAAACVNNSVLSHEQNLNGRIDESVKPHVAAAAAAGALCNGSVDETAVDALSVVSEEFISKCDLSLDGVHGAEVEVTQDNVTQ